MSGKHVQSPIALRYSDAVFLDHVRPLEYHGYRGIRKNGFFREIDNSMGKLDEIAILERTPKEDMDKKAILQRTPEENMDKNAILKMTRREDMDKNGILERKPSRTLILPGNTGVL